MTVDPRFTLTLENKDEQKCLRFTATEALVLDSPTTMMFEASLGELCELTGANQTVQSKFSDVNGRTVFSNGWQSWCYAGELATNELVRRARLVPNIAVYCDGPGPREARDEILSHFMTFIRLGWFEAQNALRDAFRDYRHFERLAFLGTEGSLVPGGYESWYNHYTRINEGIITRDLDAIKSNDNLINAYYLRRAKPAVFQIDDGWESAVGQWESDPRKFPRGMKVMAEEIEARGMIPGLWIAPLLVMRSSMPFRVMSDLLLRDARGRLVTAGFNPLWEGPFFCLDISLPEVEEYLSRVFHTIVNEWGYRYLKLDFLYAGFLRGEYRRGGASYAHFERLMSRLTSTIIDSRGRGVAYLGCGAPLEPSFRHMPLMRIGADTKEKWEDPLLRDVVRHQGRPAAYSNLSHTIGRALFDGTIFVNDPDVIFCRTANMALTEAEKELVALVDFMLASQIMFSDDAHAFGSSAEARFTAHIVGLFDKLAGGEYGAARIARDVYSISSRGGRIEGIANLSDKPWTGSGYNPDRAIVLHAKRRDKCLEFKPRSLSLFEE